MTFAVGQTQKSNANAHEVTSPLRQKLECKCKAETTHSVHDPTKDTQSRKNPNLKQIARQMAQHQTQALDTEMLTLDIAVGSKRPGIVESLEFKENRTQKRLFIASSTPHPSSLDSISAVATMQHYWEQ